MAMSSAIVGAGIKLCFYLSYRRKPVSRMWWKNKRALGSGFRRNDDQQSVMTELTPIDSCNCSLTANYRRLLQPVDRKQRFADHP